MRVVYCIAFFVFLSQSKNKDIYKSTDGFIKMFENDTLKNEQILKNYLKTMIQLKLKGWLIYYLKYKYNQWILVKR